MMMEAKQTTGGVGESKQTGTPDDEGMLGAVH